MGMEREVSEKAHKHPSKMRLLSNAPKYLRPEISSCYFTSLTSCLHPFQSALELCKFVRQLPRLLLSKSWGFLVGRHLLFNFFDSFLPMFWFHGLDPLDLNLVSGLIKHLIGTICILNFLIQLDLTFFCQATCTSHRMLRHDPLLCAHAVGELLIVADDGNTSLERFQATNQGPKTIAIKVVGWLVQDDNVGILPTRCTNDNLHFLTV